MDKVNYVSQYPLVISAGSAENINSATEKIKLEIDRIYRLLTDGQNLAGDEINNLKEYIDQLIGDLNKAITIIKNNIIKQITDLGGTVDANQQAALDSIKTVADALAALSNALGKTLTVQINGGDIGKYNGYAEKTINITADDLLKFPDDPDKTLNGKGEWVDGSVRNRVAVLRGSFRNVSNIDLPSLGPNHPAVAKGFTMPLPAGFTETQCAFMAVGDNHYWNDPGGSSSTFEDNTFWHTTSRFFIGESNHHFLSGLYIVIGVK